MSSSRSIHEQLFSGDSLATVRLGVPRRIAQLARCCWIQMKLLLVDPFTGFLSVIWPLFFATTAFLIYRVSGDSDSLTYAAVGASAMGMWSAIVTDASNALQHERWSGTLELLVTTPTSFPLVMVPVTTAMTLMGTYSMVATFVWGRLVFGIDISMHDPIAFVISVAVTILSVAMFGFLLAVTVVRYRSATALGNMLEYPGWLLCGLVVPVALLPNWVEWVSLALPPTWGVRAMREAVEGGSPWGSALICALLGLLYFGLAALFAETVLRSARRRATLSLT